MASAPQQVKLSREQMGRLAEIINRADVEKLAELTQLAPDRVIQLKEYRGYATREELSVFCRGTGVNQSYILEGTYPIFGG